MLRWLAFAVAVVLAVTGQVRGSVEIWLSGMGMESIPPGSAIPIGAGTVPEFAPRTGTAQTIYIWGRPDSGESLVNLSLNVVAETPGAISFTGATIYNPTFGGVRRFEYVDDSTGDPPPSSGTLASTCEPEPPNQINANRVCGLEGVTIFPDTLPPAVGIRSGSPADPLYSGATNNSWLIGEIDYDVLLTGAYTTTQLFLEIGRIGMTYDDESTETVSVVFGHMGDTEMDAHDQRNMHLGAADAVIHPWRLQGDFDGSGMVAPADETLWRTNFGSTLLLAIDHSGNSVVDAADYVVWRKFFGASAGAAAGIPEPSAAVLASIALMALWALRRPSFGRTK